MGIAVLCAVEDGPAVPDPAKDRTSRSGAARRDRSGIVMVWTHAELLSACGKADRRGRFDQRDSTWTVGALAPLLPLQTALAAQARRIEGSARAPGGGAAKGAAMALPIGGAVPISAAPAAAGPEGGGAGPESSGAGDQRR